MLCCSLSLEFSLLPLVPSLGAFPQRLASGWLRGPLLSWPRAPALWHSLPSPPVPFGPEVRTALRFVSYFRLRFPRLFPASALSFHPEDDPMRLRSAGRSCLLLPEPHSWTRASSAPLSPAPPQRLVPLGPDFRTRSGFEFAQRPVIWRSSFYSVFTFAI